MTAELFNTDPAKNDKQPPNGAPQGGLPLKRVSATMRVVMAGIADCWTAVKALKGMAVQDPASVLITGGAISNTTLAADCTIQATAADSNKVFGHTAQQLYDLMYPVGEARMFFNAVQPPNWPDVLAVWQLVSSGRYLRTSDPLDAGSTGGDASVSTSSDGAHSHGGVTSDTVLTTAQLPADNLTEIDLHAGGSVDAGRPIESGNNIGWTKAYGGGLGHHHSIPNEPAHTHNVQLTPLFVDVAMYRRVS